MKYCHSHRVAVILLLSTPLIASLTAQTQTSTQAPQAINLNSQSCGIDLTLPDFLVRNTDDDQELTSPYYEQWDLDHSPSPGDDDLKAVTITGTAGATAGTMSLAITGGSIKINGIFWKDGEKNDQQNQLSWPVPAFASRTETLYIEGFTNSDIPKDVEMTATMYCPPGFGADGIFYSGAGPVEVIKQTTVYEADLDVDSNNNEGITFTEGSKAEDVIEASIKAEGDWTKRPGKILMVNDGFGDDIPDWADGFISDVDHPDCYTCGPPITFIPMLLERKKPFTANCTVKFTYSASDPNEVNSVAGRGFPSYDKHFTKPQDKLIRIWKKNNDGSNRIAGSVVAGGDYVPDGIEIPWDKLNSNGEVAKLWVESVEPSGGLADISVQTEVTENGAIATDEVKFTAIKITCEPITSKSNEGLYPYNPSGVVAGESAKYQITLEPSDYPESEIKWKTDWSGGTVTSGGAVGPIRTAVFSPGSGGLFGFGSVFAEIRGNYYDPPNFEVRVYAEWKTYIINTYVVAKSDGTNAMNVAEIPPMINKVNENYRQAGVKYVQGPTEILSGLPYSDYYDCDLNTGEEVDLANYDSNTGTIEVYLVGNYRYPGVNVKTSGPFGSRLGIVCRTDFGTKSTENMAKVVAHEIGHSWGLEDIYHGDPGMGADAVVIDNRHKANVFWAPYDWPSGPGFNSDPSYYKRIASGYESAPLGVYPSPGLNEYAMRQNQIIRRLLMFGTTTGGESETELDLPIGRIHGVRNSRISNSNDEVVDDVEVGQVDMLSEPDLN